MSVRVDKLRKGFGDKLAVDKVSFGLEFGECFALLGVNGAGKTTTFRMLTGDLFPTDGNAFIGSLDLKNNLKEFQRRLGYCPQFDALLDKLTVWNGPTSGVLIRGCDQVDRDRAV